MAQGMFGGMTNYDDQSIKDITEDINEWVEYTNGIKAFIEDGVAKLKERNYWQKIPFNFQMTLLSSIRCNKTFLDDFSLILEAIKNEKVSKREIELLKKIGINAIEYNTLYGRSFKEESGWKEYGNDDFRIAENMYAKGRDYFVTLQDTANASARLSDYISAEVPMVNHTVNNTVNQTVNGNGNVVNGINNGTINNTGINSAEFSKDIESALHQLENIEGVDPVHKEYVKEILSETKDAVENGDIEIQNSSKVKMKAFLMGAGSNVLKIVHLLGTFASIASFFEL